MPCIPLSQATNTTATLVSGTPGIIIRVCNYTLTDDTAYGTATFKAEVAALTGAMVLQKGTPFAALDPEGLFETQPGEALKLVTASGAVYGHLRYVLLGSAQLNSDGTAATNIQGTLDFSLTLDSMLLGLL